MQGTDQHLSVERMREMAGHLGNNDAGGGTAGKVANMVASKAFGKARRKHNSSHGARKTTATSCQLVSYHANCRRTADEKERLMRHMLSQFESRCIYKGRRPARDPLETQTHHTSTVHVVNWFGALGSAGHKAADWLHWFWSRSGVSRLS